MIVICPNCSCKYSVHSDAIGDGKLVRCAICGTMWQQKPIVSAETDNASYLFKVTLFWFCVFITLFPIMFAPKTVVKYWPAAASFYDLIGVDTEFGSRAFSVKNVSSFFVKKQGKLCMGIKGELYNVSNEVQMVPNLIIGLRNDGGSEPNFRASWNHELLYKKLLPNQKIIFETDLKEVPYTSLICDIKLSTK